MSKHDKTSKHSKQNSKKFKNNWKVDGKKPDIIDLLKQDKKLLSYYIPNYHILYVITENNQMTKLSYKEKYWMGQVISVHYVGQLVINLVL